MPKSLAKVQKHIIKKKGKSVSLHAHSRDQKMIIRAGIRDDRVNRLANMREKMNAGYLNRVQFIKDNLPEELSPLPIDTILEFVSEYVSRNADELAEMQAARKHGKQASAREINMRQQMGNEANEFETGYWIPDLTDLKNLEELVNWTGRWVGLNPIKFVRVTKSGKIRPSSFPPKGNS